MEALKRGIESVVQQNSMRFPSNQVHICPYCKKAVPRIEIELPWGKTSVQPVCKCESEKEAKDMKRLTEYDKHRKIDELFSISDMGDRLQKATFESFERRPGTEKVFRNTRAYIDYFQDIDAEGLLIWGEPGNGKSHLAAAIAHELKKRGKTVVFLSVPELLERIRKTFSKTKQTETEHQIMTALISCNLLILDDIGAEKPTDWVSDVLFRIVDGRYRRELPIIYTSNLRPAELEEKLGRRIYDRILETTLPIQNKATSFREQKARERLQKYATNIETSSVAF